MMNELQLQAVEFFNRWMKDPNNLGETWGTRQVLAEFAEERIKAEREQIRELTAELKELREFVRAMNRVAIEEWHGHWLRTPGYFAYYDSDGEHVVTGTDPFDAWRKMNAGEGK